MSSSFVDLILNEINENFGQNCREICRILLYNDWSTITDIRHELKYLRSNEIQQYLDQLINFNLVTFQFDGKNFEWYRFDMENALSFLRYTRYIDRIGKKFGSISRTIMELFCRYGNMYLLQLLDRFQSSVIKSRDNDCEWLEMVIETVNTLILKQIIEPSPFCLATTPTVSKSHINGLIMTDVEAIRQKFHLVLHGNRDLLSVGTKRSYRQMNQSHGADDDSDNGDGNDERGCPWIRTQFKINSAQLDFLCTAAVIIDDVSLTLGDEASFLMETFLDTVTVNETFKTMSVNGLKKMWLKKKDDQDVDNNKNRKPAVNDEDEDDTFRESLYLLTNSESVRYIEKITPSGDGDDGNGNSLTLRFSMGAVVKQLVTKVVKGIVKVVFDEKGLRMFSYLLNNSHVEETAFRNSVIIPPAQITSLLANMVTRGFVTKLELSRTKQYFDEPLVSLLHVDLEKVVRNEIETCYQSIYRLAVRRQVEESRKQPIVQKMFELNTKDDAFQTIDGDGAIAAITELDTQAVMMVKKALCKLDSATRACHTSLFLFQSFIQYVNQNENF